MGLVEICEFSLGDDGELWGERPSASGRENLHRAFWCRPWLGWQFAVQGGVAVSGHELQVPVQVGQMMSRMVWHVD